jgi:Ca2+-transporting ATPase
MEWVNLTQFFTIFVMLQWWNLFNARVFGQDRSIFSGLGQNWAFTGIALVILVGQFLIVQFGGEMFRTEPLTAMEWLCIIGTTSIVAVSRETLHIIKGFIKKC